MIGVSVGDILKILDQIPIWKTVSQLPKRVQALEERCASLEEMIAAGRAAPAKAPGEACKACGESTLRRTGRTLSDGPFGALGAMDETWTCSSCDEIEMRFNVK